MTKIKELETLNILALFFLIVFIITKNPVWIYLTGTLLIISLFIKPVSRILASFWLKLSEILGRISSKVLLTLFFFLFFTPLALIRRLFRSNLLWLKKPENKTYWKSINKKFEKKDLEKTW